ncbi:hypothetical protein FD42_GL001665 [Lentilactobacillus hilgardii DSM 20176 = ATCC 8290]|nr:hypothetical protein FD42_GL001665 [Lentilactobacillus hilgardii DSM 20176 = ATCC 8290]
MGVAIALVRRKIEKTQFIKATPRKSPTIVGIAVETIVPSIAHIKVATKSAIVTKKYFF